MIETAPLDEMLMNAFGAKSAAAATGLRGTELSEDARACRSTNRRRRAR